MKVNVLLDSWAWIELFGNTPKGSQIQQKYEDAERFISVINLHEVYRKFLLQDTELAAFAKGRMLTSARTIGVSAELACRAAEFRKKYKQLSMADAIILATAEQEKAKIVTGDQDFNNVIEVEVELI